MPAMNYKSRICPQKTVAARTICDVASCVGATATIAASMGMLAALPARALEPQTGIVGISTGSYHTCALTEKQNVLCWGLNSTGQLGNGTGSTSALPVATYAITDATAIYAGGGTSCAMRQAGSVSCWGYIYAPADSGVTRWSTIPLTVPGLANASTLALGEDHGCAVLQEGAVSCWGENLNGELGDTATRYRATPAPVKGLARAVSVGVGFAQSCAVLSGGTVACWGWDRFFLHVDGTSGATVGVTPIDTVSGATAVAVGQYFACALRDTGTVVCWGDNRYGQSGDGTTRYQQFPVEVVGLSGVTAIAASDRSVCALKGDGTVACWGGLNSDASLGSAVAVAVAGVSDAVAIGVGAGHRCARLRNGGVRCWGFGGSYGQLGVGRFTFSRIPVKVSALTNTVAVNSQLTHSCAVSAQNTVSCWGTNDSGQLGDGTLFDRNSPVEVTGLSDVSDVATGTAYTCALRRNGAVACWGNNFWDWGAFGNDTSRLSLAPVDIVGVSTAKAIAVGGARGSTKNFSTACAIRSDSSVVCWGWNDYGQFGNGTTISGSAAVAVNGLTNVAQIAVGGQHTCALAKSGTVICAGFNFFGQLGDGSAEVNRTLHVAVKGIDNAIAVTAGGSHSCALRYGGGVWCWGDNTFGQLGNGSKVASNVPVEVAGLTKATAVSAGNRHTCAVLPGGEISCWGENANGKLGSGSNERVSLTPTSVDLTDAVSVSAAFAHTCALLRTGQVFCWGSHFSGELGIGPSGASSPAGQAVLSAGVRGVSKTMTEFRYAPLDYYFITSREADKAMLDLQPNWLRTGESFSVLVDGGDQATGLTRFYFDQVARGGSRGSHFYTLLDSERAALHALNRSNASVPRKPVDEAVDAYAYLPVLGGVVADSCAAGLLPVYRAFRGSQRFPDDPNHRFTTDVKRYESLLEKGWDGEGVKLCVPPAK